MISLDANVIIRYILKDIPEQSLEAARIITTLPCFVSDVTLTEVSFVLERLMEVSRGETSLLLGEFIALPNIECDEELLREVIALYAAHKNLSFPDCYVAVQSKQNGDDLATFDKALIKHGGDHVSEPKFIQ